MIQHLPINAVFHLLTIFVNVVEPEDIRICLTLFSKTFRCSSSTRRYATAVRSFVCSFCRCHTPSLLLIKASCDIRILGIILTSNPHLNPSKSIAKIWLHKSQVIIVKSTENTYMLKRRFGLSLLYTDTKLFSHSRVVILRGSLFFMSQNTLLPRFTVHREIKTVSSRNLPWKSKTYLYSNEQWNTNHHASWDAYVHPLASTSCYYSQLYSHCLDQDAL